MLRFLILIFTFIVIKITKDNMNRIMWITAISTVMVLAGVTLLILSSLPMENKIEDNTLTVRYIIGKETINLSGATFLPVPEEVNHNIIRVGGTSLGKKHSGNFMNTKTKTRYKFYLTGKGERLYFELGNKKYLIDGIQK